jgi:hypothetical protein
MRSFGLTRKRWTTKTSEYFPLESPKGEQVWIAVPAGTPVRHITSPLLTGGTLAAK